jgi:hypothetical protein
MESYAWWGLAARQSAPVVVRDREFAAITAADVRNRIGREPVETHAA